MTSLSIVPSLLVVRKDDPATGLADLDGADYGYKPPVIIARNDLDQLPADM